MIILKKTIVLTGGGTAGHVMPNIALIPTLLDMGYEVHYIGSGSIEKDLIKAIDSVTFHQISTGKLRRYFSMKNFTDPFRIIKGILQSKRIIKNINPNITFSKGGFVGVPVVIGSRMKRVPIILHESDFSIGLANKLSQPYANVVCTSFETTASHVKNGKGLYTGTPVRKELLSGDSDLARKLVQFDNPDKPTLICMGGSMGAVALNKIIRDALPLLTKEFNVIHLCGKGNLDSSQQDNKSYYQMEFASQELPHLFALADVAVSRAGANAVFELVGLSLPALLVPLPSAASRGDQDQNANYFKKRGCFDVIDQKDLTPEILNNKLRVLYQNKQEYINNLQNQGISDCIPTIIKLIEKYEKK